jgi:hypothetical protein
MNHHNDMNDPYCLMGQQRNVPYFRIWQRRYSPFIDGWYLAMYFSPQYFEKLKRELESAGYEITVSDISRYSWYSPPVGHFEVTTL